MQSLGHIIGKRLHQHKLADSARASHVIHLANVFLEDHFEDCLDEVKALSLKDGVLKIGSRSSVLSQELWHQQEELLSTLQSATDAKLVQKILITGL